MIGQLEIEHKCEETLSVTWSGDDSEVPSNAIGGVFSIYVNNKRHKCKSTEYAGHVL